MPKTIDTKPLSQELEQVALDPGRKGVIDLIRRNKDELQKLLGDTLTVDQFETATLTYLRLNPKLVECNPYSIVGALRWGAQLGLSLGPLGHFYVAPHAGEAVFILGYKGRVHLAYGSGLVKDVRAELVYAGDAFTFTYGTTPQLHHTPSGPPGEREPTHAYAIARLKTGGAPFKVIFPEDWEKAKAESQLGRKNKGPWVDHWRPMVLKTALNRLGPWLPQSPSASAAVARDEVVVDALTDEPGDVPTDEGA